MDDVSRFVVRMPPALKKKLEKSSKKNNRSINSEMVTLLTASLTAGVDKSIDSKALLTQLKKVNQDITSFLKNAK